MWGVCVCLDWTTIGRDKEFMNPGEGCTGVHCILFQFSVGLRQFNF